MEVFRSGFAAVLGRPNVGKSTLTNALIGEKVSITSPKPQTTRNNITGILNRDDAQIVFIDTPGIHLPKTKLDEYMERSVNVASKDADVTLYVVPAKGVNDKDRAFVSGHTGLIVVINKVDTIPKPQLLEEIRQYAELGAKEIVPVSALKGDNVDALRRLIIERSPTSPPFFPADIATTQTERAIVAETIREKALILLRDEVPHGIAVEITNMKRRNAKNGAITDIDAVIYCEKDTHKGIVIGKGGGVLKRIGELARIDAERMLGGKIFLTVRVKVKNRWRDDEILVKNFGYNKKAL